MAHFNQDIHRRSSVRLTQVIPEAIQARYPKFVAFLRAYYEFLEQQDTNPVEPVFVPQQGVVTIVAGISTVTGTNTTFNLLNRGAEANTGVREYDRIRVGGETFTVRANTVSNTELVLFDVPTRTYYANNFSLETQRSVRQASGAIRQIMTFHEVDETLDDLIVHFQDTFLRGFPSTGTDYRVLIPQILSFYQARGSENSYRFLFRALYGEEIMISYPRDSTFTTSGSTYVTPTILRLQNQAYDAVVNPSGLLFGSDSTGNVYALENRVIVGLTSNVRAQVSRVRQEQLGNVSSLALNVTDYVIPDVPSALILDVDEPGVLWSPNYRFTIRTGNTVMVASGNVASRLDAGLPLYVADNSGRSARIIVESVAANGTHITLQEAPTDTIANALAYRVNTNGGRILIPVYGVPPDQNERLVYQVPVAAEPQPETSFVVGERISTLPLEDPLRIQGTVLGSVVGFEVVDGGTDFRVGDMVYVPQIAGQIEGYGAVGRVTSLSQTQISTVNIVNPGEGYYTGLSLIVDNSGTGGSGLAGYVSQITAGQILSEDGDVILIPSMSGIDGVQQWDRLTREDVIYYERGVQLSSLLRNSTDTANANIVIGSSDWSQSNALSAWAGVGLSTRMGDVLQKLDVIPIFVNGVPTPIGEVSEITITSDGRNYVTGLPLISVTNPVRPRDGAGVEVPVSILPFVQSMIEGQITPGIIGSVRVVTGGAGYGASNTFAVTTGQTSSINGNGAILRARVGSTSIGQSRFVDDRSFASRTQYLQDDTTYQPFAYRISSEIDASVYQELIRKLLHPAGGRILSDRMVTSTGVLAASGTMVIGEP